MSRHDPGRSLLVLRFIEGYWADHGYAPSIRDIARGVGLASTNSAHIYVQRLARWGYLTYDPGVARSIRVATRTMA